MVFVTGFWPEEVSRNGFGCNTGLFNLVGVLGALRLFRLLWSVLRRHRHILRGLVPD